MRRLLVRQAVLLGGSVLLTGCTLFSRRPPLPQHAAIERAGAPAGATDYRAIVEEADVIYFPIERAASGAKSEPAALLLEAVQQSGKTFTIAFESIDTTQQAMLDQLQTGEARREELIRKLDLAGSGRAREHCRSVLREVRTTFLALRLPSPISEKLASGGALSADEQAILPGGYKPPAGGYDAYAENLANRGSVADYRTDIARREFAAEMIVRHFRAVGSDAKLVVFAQARDFADDGVPFYVAQKLNLRQLVLGRERSAPSRGSLLAVAR